MIDYAITSVTGWVMMVLLIAIIAYPFLLRAGFLGPIQPFLPRMRLHAWLVYSLGIALLIHIWFSMSSELALIVNTLGLYLATIAMFLVGAQILLGRTLSWPKLAQRRIVQRSHFWVMVGLVILILGHIVLDSAMLQVVR
ncbi:MAG: hypothetical protein H0V70_04075 [Ktedonobacteraceae bacterium]|nr:hypothetical protein [Ktedonobacteraceae bacterium]